jgi:hypothetical protein
MQMPPMRHRNARAACVMWMPDGGGGGSTEFTAGSPKAVADFNRFWFRNGNKWDVCCHEGRRRDYAPRLRQVRLLGELCKCKKCTILQLI